MTGLTRAGSTSGVLRLSRGFFGDCAVDCRGAFARKISSSLLLLEQATSSTPKANTTTIRIMMKRVPRTRRVDPRLEHAGFQTARRGAARAETLKTSHSSPIPTEKAGLSQLERRQIATSCVGASLFFWPKRYRRQSPRVLRRLSISLAARRAAHLFLPRYFPPCRDI